jgi:2',3'-cyclic-nucleotide 2'-phosphodiesterase
MLESGADALTLGNHVFRRGEIVPYLKESDRIVRPANLSARAPGKKLIVVNGVAVFNLLGFLFLNPPVNPFEVVDEIVESARKQTPIIVLDMHGEATSEKVAMAKWLDGKVTAVIGTHTHIQTNDARVQPGGTAAIRAMRTSMPVRFETASGDVRIEGVLVECGDDGRATSCEPVRVPLA